MGTCIASFVVPNHSTSFFKRLRSGWSGRQIRRLERLRIARHCLYPFGAIRSQEKTLQEIFPKHFEQKWVRRR